MTGLRNLLLGLAGLAFLYGLFADRWVQRWRRSHAVRRNATQQPAPADRAAE